MRVGIVDGIGVTRTQLLLSVLVDDPATVFNATEVFMIGSSDDWSDRLVYEFHLLPTATELHRNFQAPRTININPQNLVGEVVERRRNVGLQP